MGAQILDFIWAMRQNRFIGAGEVTKYNAKLNVMEATNSWAVILGDIRAGGHVDHHMPDSNPDTNTLIEVQEIAL